MAPADHQGCKESIANAVQRDCGPGRGLEAAYPAFHRVKLTLASRKAVRSALPLGIPTPSF